MAYQFKGRNILVTGAGQNIGRTIATNLAKLGAKVYALDYVKETLDNLVGEIDDIIPVLQDLQDWDNTVKTVSQLGAIDGLVNCAGLIYPSQDALDVPKERLDKCIDVDLNAPINLMQVVGKKMVASGNGGSIVNIASVGGTHALKGVLPYAVAKAGLIMASKVFALELGPHNIRVNCVNPGPVMTELFKTVVNTEEMLQKHVSNTPLGRFSEMQDVANLVLFLLSEQSTMISGACYVIDGGMTCQLPS